MAKERPDYNSIRNRTIPAEKCVVNTHRHFANEKYGVPAVAWWVKDPAFPWLWHRLPQIRSTPPHRGLGTTMCHGCGQKNKIIK